MDLIKESLAALKTKKGKLEYLFEVMETTQYYSRVYRWPPKFSKSVIAKICEIIDSIKLS